MLINILLNEFYLKKSKKEKWGGTRFFPVSGLS